MFFLSPSPAPPSRLHHPAHPDSQNPAPQALTPEIDKVTAKFTPPAQWNLSFPYSIGVKLLCLFCLIGAYLTKACPVKSESHLTGAQYI